MDKGAFLGGGGRQLFEFLRRNPPWELIPNWEPKGASSLSLMLKETFSFITIVFQNRRREKGSHPTWELIPNRKHKGAQPLSHISFRYQFRNRRKRAGSYYRPHSFNTKKKNRGWNRQKNPGRIRVIRDGYWFPDLSRQSFLSRFGNRYLRK